MHVSYVGYAVLGDIHCLHSESNCPKFMLECILRAFWCFNDSFLLIRPFLTEHSYTYMFAWFALPSTLIISCIYFLQRKSHYYNCICIEQKLQSFCVMYIVYIYAKTTDII